MGGVAYRFRADARARWSSWAILALLVAAFGAAALTGIAGARRTETAYLRLDAKHAGADAFVEDFIPNPDAVSVTHAQVASTAGVADSELVHSYSFESASIDGLSPTATAAALTAAGQSSVELVASEDGRAYGTGLDRPKLLAGRLPDPRRTDEVAVDFEMPVRGPGSRITVFFDRSLGGDPHQPDQEADPLPLTFRVVGVVAVPGQFPPQSSNNYIGGAAIYATPAFARAHGSDLLALDYDLVRRAPGTSETVLENNLQRLSPNGAVVPINRTSIQVAEVVRSTHVESLALWLLTALVGIVGVLVLGHVFARAAALEGTDLLTLGALGMSRRQLLGMGLLRAAAIGVAAGLLAAVGALLASPLMPIGLARVAEPAPGLAASWAVLGLGAAVVAVSCTLLAALPWWWSTGRSGASREPASRGSVVVAALAAAGAPPTASCGVWMALDRGRGRRAVPVRSTLAGATIGLAAVAAALTVGASLTHLLTTPSLYGVTWAGDILNNNGPDAVPAAIPILKADPDVAGAAYRYAGLTVQVGKTTTEGDVFIPVKNDLGPTIVAGRAPGDGEIAIGSRTMSQLHLHLGDRVPASAENEQAPPVTLSVVGQAILPPGNYVGRLGSGVVVNQATLQQIAGVPEGFRLRRPYIISLAFRPGVNVEAATKRLTAELVAADPAFFIQPPPEPTDLVNFGRIQNLPLVLAAILALLAAATIIHLLSSSVRRRRRELAVLKTMGFDQPQVRRTVAWQATTLGLFAAGLGIPLGLIAGRVIWSLLAGSLGTVPQPVAPALTLIALLPATVLLANAVGAVPAALAGRIPPAEALRTE